MRLRVFGISRAGAVWCPVNPRNEAAENRELLDLFGCTTLVFAAAFSGLVDAIRADLPALTTLVCLDGDVGWALTWEAFLARAGEPVDRAAVDDLAMIVGTGGTTGRPKGVLLTGTNLETMTALTLMSYPWPDDRPPTYLALAPLTHAAGVLCFPVLCRGGAIVVMRSPDVGAFLDLVEEQRVTHTFLPPTLVYMVLDHPGLDARDLSSLRCFWYGAAPMSTRRVDRPRAAGLRGPSLRADDGGGHGRRRRPPPPRRARRDRRARLAGDARLPPRPGGDGGSVEQAVMAHPAVADCAVVGLPDEKWGERVTAVVQLRPGAELDTTELQRFVRDRVGGVKAPKQVEVWPDLPRSKVGKVLKTDVKARLTAG